MMNIVPLLAFYLIHSKTQYVDNDIGQSLVYVVEKFFMPRSSSFLLIVSCEREQTMDFYKDIQDTLFQNLRYMKTQIVVNNEVVGPTLHGDRLYNLLLIDSWESFLKIDLASQVAHFDVSEYYYIFLQNLDKLLFYDIQRIFEYCWRNHIVNVNIQVLTPSGELIVYSYFPFTPNHCGKVVPVEINRYRNGKMDSDILFPYKHFNMYNCSLRVATWSVPPYVTLDMTANGHYEIGGFEGTLLLQLSKLMNFSIEIIIPPNDEQRGYLFDNHSTGAIGMLQRGEADLSLGCFYVQEKRSRSLTASDFYFQIGCVAMFVRNLALQTQFNCIWFPYKKKLTHILLTLYLLALILIFVVTCLLAKYSRFFRSRSFGIILINFTACCLSLPYTLIPRRNSVRIVVMTWIIYIMLIRTEYQAVIYSLLRKNFFKQTPNNFAEIVKRNYTLVVHRDALETLTQTTILTETGLNHIMLNSSASNMDKILNFLTKYPTEKLLTIAPREILWDYTVKEKNYGVIAMTKDPLMLQNACIYLQKHSILIERINFLVQRMNAVGLLNRWVKRSVDFTYLMAKRPPQVAFIGTKELMSIYYVFVAMLTASILVFLLEITTRRLELLRKVFNS